jgi:hypothetical protein
MLLVDILCLVSTPMQEKLAEVCIVYTITIYVHVMSCFLKRLIGQEAAFCRCCYGKNTVLRSRVTNSLAYCSGPTLLMHVKINYLYYIHFVMFQFLKAVGIREGCALFSKLPAIFGQACPNMAGIGVVMYHSI